MNMMLGSRSATPVASLAFAFLFTLCGIASAADGDKGPTFTEPPEDDANYALLGEFVGPIQTGENEYAPLGLQVRPVGGDNFEAVQFLGGLPGQEKHQPEGVTLVGRRSGDFVVLSGGPWAVFVEQDHCLILDREGKRVGRLERIARQSPTLGAQPPKEAVVLFDGKDTDSFTKAEMTEEGLLTQGADFKPMFQDFDLHLEFRLPYMPAASSQGRANSGVYLQSRYECQVLDSFAQERLFNGCGSLYRFRKPDVNMCLPPLVWQTYDIRFTAPRWAADGSKIRNARITAWLNGVKVQDDVELPNKTGAGKAEEPVLLPTRLQDHGDPVRFRNVWVIDRGLAADLDFPVQGGEEPVEQADASTGEAKSEEPASKADDQAGEEEPSEKATEEGAADGEAAPENGDAGQEASSDDASQNKNAEQGEQEAETNGDSANDNESGSEESEA